MDESITEVAAAEIISETPKKRGRPKGVINKTVRKDKGVLRGPRKPKRVMPPLEPAMVDVMKGETHAIE